MIINISFYYFLDNFFKNVCESTHNRNQVSFYITPYYLNINMIFSYLMIGSLYNITKFSHTKLHIKCCINMLYCNKIESNKIPIRIYYISILECIYISILEYIYIYINIRIYIYIDN